MSVRHFLRISQLYLWETLDIGASRTLWWFPPSIVSARASLLDPCWTTIILKGCKLNEDGAVWLNLKSFSISSGSILLDLSNFFETDYVAPWSVQMSFIVDGTTLYLQEDSQEYLPNLIGIQAVLFKKYTLKNYFNEWSSHSMHNLKEFRFLSKSIFECELHSLK